MTTSHNIRPGTSTPVPESTDMDPLAASLIDLHFALERVYETASKQVGITAQQAQLLCVAGWKNAALGELATELHCDKTNVTGLVDRVERMGLVDRVPDRDDRRVTRLELTKKGRTTVTRFHDELNRRLSGINPDLTVDSAKLTALAAHLRGTGSCCG